MNIIELRPIREVLNITQQDMAAVLGVSRLTYIKWENNLDKMPLGRYAEAWKHLSRLNDLKTVEGKSDDNKR